MLKTSMKPLFLLLSLAFLLGGCTPAPSIVVTGDFLIATANLLYKNTGNISEVSEVLLNQEADVLILVEAVPGGNFDQDLLEKAGYTCFLTQGSHQVFNILLAVKGETAFGTIPVDFSPSGQISLSAPFATCRITRGENTLCILGVHIPAPFYLSEEVRDLAFSGLTGLLEDGRFGTEAGCAQAGDLAILGGDFNSFPSDVRMLNLVARGLTDTQTANPDLYTYTWTPGIIPQVARIDYILTARQLRVTAQTTFSIPGSDHRGILAGVEL